MGLVMQLLKFWLDVKSGYNPPRVVNFDSGIRPSHFVGEDIHWARQDNRMKNLPNFNPLMQNPQQEYNWANNNKDVLIYRTIQDNDLDK